jgi:hypothetical protein
MILNNVQLRFFRCIGGLDPQTLSHHALGGPVKPTHGAG